MKLKKKIIIVYATHSGNTESEAFRIKAALEKTAASVECLDATKAHGEIGADLMIFGCSTYGDGEMCGEASEFFERLDRGTVRLNAGRVAVFGLGESVYPEFASCVIDAERAFQSRGYSVAVPSLRIDMMSYDQSLRDTQMSAWLEQISASAEDGRR